MPGVAAALNADNAGIKEAVKIWEKRRNCMLNELDGLPVIPPQGGWSMLIDTMQIGLSSVDASQRLFSQAKIAATPMKGWGESGSRYLRLVFSNEPENRLAGMRAKIRKAWGLSS
jgi:N-succinyldiaminopimelate aminotransferase